MTRMVGAEKASRAIPEWHDYAWMARQHQLCMGIHAKPVWAHSKPPHKGWLAVEARLSSGSVWCLAGRGGRFPNWNGDILAMAVPTRIPVRFEDMFPHGAYVLSVD